MMPPPVPSRRGAFPPPIGWIPATIALLVALILSAFAFVPQYVNRPVEIVGAGTGAGAGGTAGTQGTAAQTITTNGTAGSAGSGGGTAATSRIACAAGRNGGGGDPGVSATELHVASTIVTSGIGSGFLGEAQSGIQAAINEANNSGGVCGRALRLDTINTGWDRTQGNTDISNWIGAGGTFALVGEPDSEGLAGAIEGQTIDRAGIPVVGTDGMLADQYNDPWVWPVAASTVTNVHVIAQYAVNTLHAQSFGIVYDTFYKFGAEGALAFDAEIHRLTGSHIQGYDQGKSCTVGTRFCGINSNQGSFQDSVSAFNSGCNPRCDVVVMLLEPTPMATWMKEEKDAKDSHGSPVWYQHLFGGEPLFDDKFGQTCAGECGGMTVWTGYHAAIQPFDAEPAVYTYTASLKSACPTCDAHNEFTEGAYMGTRLFIEACKRVQAKGLRLTRANLRDELNTDSFDFGLASGPLHFGSSLPRQANRGMAAFSANAIGSFNGWNYLTTGFIPDPAPGQDLR
jgi:ABC-type branched-subunit amino acid transport system substrate-binding protein